MKKNCITVTIVLMCILFCLTGCGAKVSSSIQPKETKETAKEFVMVYKQDALFSIYRHEPTNMMYLCYVGNGVTPMGITWEEYQEKAAAFHEENDTVVKTE